jgi:nicotinamidase-related amidase
VDLQRHETESEQGVGRRARERGLEAFLAEYYARVHDVVLPNVVRLQAAFREQRIEVIHIRVAAATADGRDNTRRYKRMGAASAAGGTGTEFAAGVGPIDDELVINKLTSSPFNSTNIDRVLRNLGVSNVVVVGLVTNGCVESTARSAAELDYDVAVVADATAAMAPQLHDASLLNMSYKDAAIVSTDYVLRRLRARLPRETSKGDR